MCLFSELYKIGTGKYILLLFSIGTGNYFGFSFYFIIFSRDHKKEAAVTRKTQDYPKLRIDKLYETLGKMMTEKSL